MKGAETKGETCYRCARVSYDEKAQTYKCLCSRMATARSMRRVKSNTRACAHFVPKNAAW